MQTVTRMALSAALRSLGLAPGMGVMVHSAVQFLGRPEAGLETYLLGLDDVLHFLSAGGGPQGTLAVPTFNFAFARGEDYDPLTTPAQGMGVFSEYVRRQPQSRRTAHPLQSVALIGHDADLLAGLDTPGAFDPESAFERMLDLDYRLLLLGADVQAVSMVHYAEQRAAVPYRYWKDFSGKYRNPQGGGWEMRTCRMFVRDLALDPQLVLRPVQTLLEGRAQWAEIPFNYGRLASCRLRDFAAAAEDTLQADPWGLVAGGNPHAAGRQAGGGLIYSANGDIIKPA